MCRRLLANPVMETASWEIRSDEQIGEAGGAAMTLDRPRGRGSPSRSFPGTWSERDFAHVAGAGARLGATAGLAHRDRPRRQPMRSSCPAASRTATTCAPGRSPASRRSWARSRRSRAAGGPVIGSCNGFQILAEAGLLPGALMRNDHLEFRCDWQTLRVESPGVAPAWLGDLDDGERDPPADQPRRGPVRRRSRDARRARGRRSRRAALRRCRWAGRPMPPTRTARSGRSPASSTSAATSSG